MYTLHIVQILNAVQIRQSPVCLSAVSPVVLVPIVIVAEVSMLGYLLIKGVRESASDPGQPLADSPVSS